MYKAKVAVCSEIRTKHSTQSEYRVEFLMLNLVKLKETARLYRLNCQATGILPAVHQNMIDKT
jgi:hypothetical protein